MRITVASGLGEGPTELAAFDAALLAAGAANYNLLILSSVIPPGSVIDVLEGTADPGGGWGDRLYVVMAQERVAVRNEEAWAGLGWVQYDDGRGLFVEHHGHSRKSVENDIECSLEAMTTARGLPPVPVRMQVAGGSCGDEALCALVIATYAARPWQA